MKTALKVLAVALTLWAVLLVVGVSIAKTTPSPVVKTVEKLAFQRDKADGDRALRQVQCASTRNPYMFYCAFIGKNICGATYVHYNPHNPAFGRPHRVNFWNQVWACTSPRPKFIPTFQGDGGPGA